MQQWMKDRLVAIYNKATKLDMRNVILNRISFHQYSSNNWCLILMQNPLASQVAGVGAWNKLGRRVLAGQHGLAIMAPNIVKSKHIIQVDGKEDEIIDEYLAGFRFTYVFDVSQTSGPPLPPPAHRQFVGEFNCEDYDEVYNLILPHHKIEYKPMAYTTSGSTNGTDISLSFLREKVALFATLFHELGHILLQHMKSNLSKAQREVEAELFAAYWTYTWGYEYPHEIYLNEYITADLKLVDILRRVDRAVKMAEKILLV